MSPLRGCRRPAGSAVEAGTGEVRDGVPHFFAPEICGDECLTGDRRGRVRQAGEPELWNLEFCWLAW
jgi:hypothetical protein